MSKSMSDHAFLEIQNISKTYPGVQALHGVSIDVNQGLVHGLVGENGAGKSTLIKILAGAETADPGGEIRLKGQHFEPATPKDALVGGISTIYQVFNLLPDRAIMHNVLLGQEPAKRGILNMKVMKSETVRVLDMLGAGHLSPDTLVGKLKVGEQQVVEIAKALVNKSELLVMDEPTAALNQAEAEALFDNVRTLRAEGVTILYVSHRLNEIFDLADTVSVLRDGEHIVTGDITSFTRESLIEAMIGRKLEGVFPERQGEPGDEILRLNRISSDKVLSDVSLTLHKGEILAVAGLSGSGKTELGKVIYGDLPIDQGQITVAGEPFRPQPARAIDHRVIYLPEDRKNDGVLQELSVRRNISLSVLRNRVANRFGILSPKRERQVAQEQIDGLDIKTPTMEQEVLYLSGGNQQKVALGRCLAADPEVFIMMEPTQGIDVGVKFEIYQFIVEQAAEGKAILLISSELAEILGLAHRVLVMHDGRIIADLDTGQTDQEEILRYALGDTKDKVTTQMSGE